jgi:hypothetical protein
MDDTATQYEFVSGFVGDTDASWEVSSHPDIDGAGIEQDVDGLELSRAGRLRSGSPVLVDDGGGSVVSGLTGAQFRYFMCVVGLPRAVSCKLASCERAYALKKVWSASARISQ